MAETETTQYITKKGTIYEQTKELEGGTLTNELWFKIYGGQRTQMVAAGYVAPSDLEELAEFHKKMIVMPGLSGPDTTMNIGESRTPENFVRLINDFKYTGGHDLGGRVVFLENSKSTNLQYSSEVIKIV